MTGTPQPKSFRIDASLLGGTITVDGVGPLTVGTDILGYELIAAGPERPTRLLLHVPTEGVVEGEGIVETIRDAPSGDQVRALSAEKIRAAATPLLSLGSSSAAVFRDVIADMLDAQAGAA